MINIFLNEEYGYSHWWWEFPGSIEELVEDWSTGHAPFLGKPYKGTLTELPVESSPDDPFSRVMAGRTDSYTVHRPGEDPQLYQSSSMATTFQATAEVDVEHPYLRVGEEVFPAYGDLLPEEQEIADSFRWADWTEDPPYYEQWFKDWSTAYSCGRTDPALLQALGRGELSPQRSQELSSHLQVCAGCRTSYYAKPR